MKDERDYQTKPQSEDELNEARAVIQPAHDHDYKATAPETREDEHGGRQPVRGLQIGSKEQDQELNEDFEYRQQRKEVREQITRDFINRISTKPTQPGEGKDYTELYNELKKGHITNISLPEFTNIIEHHSTTPGTPRAAWMSTRANAHRFRACAGLTRPEFNKCFTMKDGRDLSHNDKDKSSKQTPFTELLSKHFEK